MSPSRHLRHSLANNDARGALASRRHFDLWLAPPNCGNRFVVEEPNADNVVSSIVSTDAEPGYGFLEAGWCRRFHSVARRLLVSDTAIPRSNREARRDALRGR
jgi:hypothetical protein